LEEPEGAGVVAMGVCQTSSIENDSGQSRGLLSFALLRRSKLCDPQPIAARIDHVETAHRPLPFARTKNARNAGHDEFPKPCLETAAKSA